MSQVHFTHTSGRLTFEAQPIKLDKPTPEGKPRYDIGRVGMVIEFDPFKGWHLVGIYHSVLPTIFNPLQARIVGAAFTAMAREAGLLLNILKSKVAAEDDGSVPVGKVAWTMDELTELAKMTTDSIQRDLDFHEKEYAA